MRGFPSHWAIASTRQVLFWSYTASTGSRPASQGENILLSSYSLDLHSCCLPPPSRGQAFLFLSNQHNLLLHKTDTTRHNMTH